MRQEKKTKQNKTKGREHNLENVSKQYLKYSSVYIFNSPSKPADNVLPTLFLIFYFLCVCVIYLLHILPLKLINVESCSKTGKAEEKVQFKFSQKLFLNSVRICGQKSAAELTQPAQPLRKAKTNLVIKLAQMKIALANIPSKIPFKSIKNSIKIFFRKFIMPENTNNKEYLFTRLFNVFLYE